MSRICIICGLPVEKDLICHIKCCRKMFGKNTPPSIPFGMRELKTLAGQIISQKTTMTGVQKKLSLTISEESKQSKLTFVGMWGDYILKPQVKAYPQLPENEFLTLCLADLYKIRTVPHALLPLASGEPAYVTKRIDRSSSGKIHMEDMAQILERMTEDKYKGSAEQIGKQILKHCENRILDALRFYEVVLFSYLTGNSDMHLKNYSLIYGNTGIELAPAYDLVNTRLVISEKEDPDESALSINGKRRKLKMEDFLALGESLKLTKPQLLNVQKRFISGKDQAEQLIDNSFLSLKMKEKYKTVFSRRIEVLGN